MEFTELIDLASEKLGGAVLAANDEFFAPKENLLKASAPVFIEGKYTHVGKWMDGWETRRRRTPGFDWCVIRLGLPGIIRGVVVDTSHFVGNYPEHCSLDGCTADGNTAIDYLLEETTKWSPILPQLPLQSDSQQHFSLDSDQRFTHLRLNIFPDGGVARLRAYGEVVPDWTRLKSVGGEIDLAAVENGGLVISCSDMFFGHRHNLIMPGRAINMSDGWETKRRRGPGHDWVIIKLGSSGSIHRIEVDTSHFKGNFPESCALEACYGLGMSTESLSDLAAPWKTLLPRTKLQAHTRHLFEEQLIDTGMVSHVRFNIFPDGGVSRLRIYGRVD